ncbi:nuclear transport factor 2 family protein [Hymenobacter sp.]|uniref:nuclear transport factor 2 family protein n=1 Tax=Hymenobacter sp. TaxID=1898978 RepID=UPI00286A824B|nr:nuclear transport factor 2 family protein [Hymenobacter sp.]
MNAAPQQLAEAFSRHEFETTRPYLADAIRWNMVGSEVISGKENVVNTCQQSVRYLADVQVNFMKCRVIAGDQHVVVESLAEYTDPQQQLSKVASCDIYEFADGKIVEITSYAVEIPLQ